MGLLFSWKKGQGIPLSLNEYNLIENPPKTAKTCTKECKNAAEICIGCWHRFGAFLA